MKCLKFLLNITAAIFAVVAAAIWLVSAIIRINKPSRDASGLENAKIIAVEENGEKWDVVQTLSAQSLWSAWAAIFAGLSALCQSINCFIPDSN